MARYSEEFKEKIAQKMMPPNSASVAQIHRETGVSEPTLYSWKNNFQQRGMAVPADPTGATAHKQRQRDFAEKS